MKYLVQARRLLFLAAMGVLASAPSRGTTSGFSWPSGRDAFAAGSNISLSWSLPAGHEREFSEMELVLSLDGGRTFPVRVTRELNPAMRALDWRVPALPSPRARLALRAGDDGRPADEGILLVSEEFAIEMEAGSRLEPTAFVRGELRTFEALEDGDSAAAPEPGVLEETDLAVAAAGHSPSPAAPRRPRTIAAESSTHCAAASGSAVSSARPMTHTLLLRVPADAPRRE